MGGAQFQCFGSAEFADCRLDVRLSSGLLDAIYARLLQAR